MAQKSMNNRSSQKTKSGSPKKKEGSNTGKTAKKDVQNPKQKKKVWSFDGLVEAMKPTCEELDYRHGKSEEADINPLEKYSKLFKCTKCQRNLKQAILQKKKVPIHPCLGVLMCEKCCNYYVDGEFSVDSDGEDKYCRWCGEGGTIFTCSSCICGFCKNCIKNHFSLKYFKYVQKDENWLCFFCDSKPLWYERYICSLAVQMSEQAVTSLSATPKKDLKRNVSKEKESSALSTEGEEEEGKEKEVEEDKEEEEEKEVEEEEEKEKEEEEEEEEKEKEKCITVSCPSKNKRKRLRTFSSSSDETDIESLRSPLKTFKVTSSPLKTSVDQGKSDLIDNTKIGDLHELKKLLKLSENQMSFGVSWCSETLKKLAKPDYKVTQEGLVDECKKIKWFLSVLSTYLVQFSNSVDSIEKSLCQNDGEKVSSNFTEKNQSPYTIILQFLGFVNNQIKTFVQKGVTFSDILEASVYDDENVIGIRKKSSSENKSSGPVTCKASVTNDDSEAVENKEDCCDGNRREDSLEPETDENNENNTLESNNSSPLTFGETSTSKTLESAQEIQNLISILENA